MKPYSLDLRARIVRAVGSGMSQPEAATVFRVGERTVKRYLHQWRTTGALLPRPRPGKRPTIRPEQYPAVLAQLAATPDATLEEHCARWHERTGGRISASAWCRLEQRLGWTHKKSR